MLRLHICVDTRYTLCLLKKPYQLPISRAALKLGQLHSISSGNYVQGQGGHIEWVLSDLEKMVKIGQLGGLVIVYIARVCY